MNKFCQFSLVLVTLYHQFYHYFTNYKIPPLHKIHTWICPFKSLLRKINPRKKINRPRRSHISLTIYDNCLCSSCETPFRSPLFLVDSHYLIPHREFNNMGKTWSSFSACILPHLLECLWRGERETRQRQRHRQPFLFLHPVQSTIGSSQLCRISRSGTAF